MIRLFNLLAAAWVYTCVATVISAAVGVGAMWQGGMLAESRLTAALSALQGKTPLAEKDKKEGDPATAPPGPSLEELVAARFAKQLDLDLREQALAKALTELRNLQLGVKVERERFDQQYDSFKAELDRLRQNVTDSAIGEVQRTLEAIEPKQAKEQLLRMLDDPELQPEERLLRVTTLVKAMAMEKRKKIIAEFKTREEADKLSSILKQLGEGEPEKTALDKAGKELEQVAPRGEKP